jgi:hypothetical protein
MKHIKKKHLFQEKGTLKNLENIAEVIKTVDASIIKKSKNKDSFIETEDGDFIKTFVFNRKGIPAIIPIPDLTLVYYDSAYNLNVFRKEQEINLFDKVLVKNEKLGEQAINEIYRYYGYSSSCIISLFTTLESFVNHIIPHDKPYVKTLKNKTETYDKNQIQNHIQFDEKIKDVLPFFFDGKNYFKNPTKNTQHIENLKNIRNEIVHPKSEITFRTQEELVKRLLNFKYEATFDAVAAFINFYKPDYIKECDCGVDF